MMILCIMLNHGISVFGYLKFVHFAAKLTMFHLQYTSLLSIKIEFSLSLSLLLISVQLNLSMDK